MTRIIYTLLISLVTAPAFANTIYNGEFNTPMCPSSESVATIHHAKISGLERNPHYDNRFGATGSLDINGRAWHLYLESPEIVDTSDKSLVAAHDALQSLSNPYSLEADLRVSVDGQIWVCEYFGSVTTALLKQRWTYAMLYTKYNKSSDLL